jgi:hypothetical protein
MDPVDLTAVRLLVAHENRLHKLARLAWSNKDVSLYVLPYLPKGGTAHAGVMKIPGPAGPPSTWNYTGQVDGSGGPKLTLHSSGRCHGEVDGVHGPPVWGRPLTGREGGHIASITCFSVEGLPEVTVPSGPPSADIVLQSSDPSSTATNVALFVLTSDRKDDEYHFVLTFRREGLDAPVRIGIRARVTTEPSGNRDPGVLVMAGWGPGDTGDRPLTGVFVVTKGP